MSPISSLRNHFLIAMPHLSDPNFFHAVALICEHTEDGAMGFIINQPLSITAADILEQMNIESHNENLKKYPVLAGGPVQIEQGFVIHQDHTQWNSSLNLDSDIIVTASRDILAAMANNQGPKQNLIILGYSGWEAGQLEEEIAKNFWLSCPVDHAILFEHPFEQRWRAAAQLIGVDVNKLTGDSGHS